MGTYLQRPLERFWNMRGYAGRFQNGFDCQGLWVEVEVEKELGIRNKKISKISYRATKKKALPIRESLQRACPQV